MEKLSILYKSIINEINWDDDFDDVKKSCQPTKDVVDYLNKRKANFGKDTKDREKFSQKYPFLHSNSKHFESKSGFIEIDEFIKSITRPPKSYTGINEKMSKSGGANEHVYNTGIPSIRGIVYDIEHEKFYFIDTCPGAGACKEYCYTLNGNYIRYQASFDNMTNRLNYMMNFPEKYEEGMYKELAKKCEEHKAFEGYKSRVVLRWNDSGDFFSKRYTQIAESVMSRLKEAGYNIISYGYTKMADMNKDSEIATKFSSGANKRQNDKVDKNADKSIKLSPEISKDLNLMKVEDEQTLKQRVAKQFKLDVNKLLTYDEIKSTRQSDDNVWNVIVTPNDGDDAAFRPDVKNVYLVHH